MLFCCCFVTIYAEKLPFGYKKLQLSRCILEQNVPHLNLLDYKKLSLNPDCLIETLYEKKLYNINSFLLVH